MFAFMRDLLTEDEIVEFSLRLDIASRLHQWQNYKKIEKETWASSTTIARVAKFLKGKFGGYRKVLK
jgi:TrpR-related protein YerC/YecD